MADDRPQPRYDLFISYARHDNRPDPEHDQPGDRVTELVQRIKADYAAFDGRRPLNVFFDVHEIRSMEDWQQRILQGLRESRLLLACISPAYLNSKNCKWEFNEYLKNEAGHRHGYFGVTPVYFVTIDRWYDSAFDDRWDDWVRDLRHRQGVDLRPWHGAGEDALKEAAVRDSLAELNQQIAGIIQRGENAERYLGSVDSHNPNFVGRTTALRALRDAFVKPGWIGVLTAVNGLGGVGKTALAVEYAHAFAGEYGGGRWQVLCAGQDDLRLALSTLSTPLGFEYTDDEKLDLDRQLRRTLRELRARADAAGASAPHRCLLLLDNVDHPSLLAPAAIAQLGAADWLHVIATTRLGERDLHGEAPDRTFLAVDELSAEEAISLIERYQPNRKFASVAEWEAAREIVRRLGCFTLAVESAAVYLGHAAPEGVTCAGFLTRLQREGIDGLDAAGARSGADALLHRERSLRATLEPTLAALSPEERLTLEYAALLPPDQVPLPWLRALVSQTYPALGAEAGPGYPDPWLSVLRRLLGQRLLQETDATDPAGRLRIVRMHRLVQELVQSRVPASQHADHARAIERLVQQRDRALESTSQWTDARWEIEPMDALAYAWADADHANAAWLLNQVGRRWYAVAEWTRAEPLMRRALAIDEASYGAEHPKVAIRLNNLATLLQATNRLSEAEPLKRRALAIDEASYGAEHPTVARDLNNLATLLQDTNRLSEAEPLKRRALAIDEASYGAEHPTVAIRLSNLASLLQATNRLSEAEPLMRRALAIDEASYGAEHPNVAIRLSNLASLLQATNRLSEAEPLMRRALAIDEASYGAEHPEVATDLNNLAQLLKATNRLSEAEPLLRRALAIDEASYGPEHPKVATDLNNLAQLLKATNRLSEAEPLMRRAVTIREHALVPGHPWTLGSMQALADILEALGRAAEAAGWRRRRLTIIAEQPDQTPLALRTLALDAYKLGDYALAATLLERVLAAGFEPASTQCHLARLALLQADDALAAHHADAGWADRASAEPYVVPRILWLQVACALLAGASGDGSATSPVEVIGRLKTALSADGAVVEWAMDPVLAALAARLPAADADLLRALVAAMSFPDRVDALDAFPLWRDAKPLPIPQAE